MKNWLIKISQNPVQLISTVTSSNIDNVVYQLEMMGGNVHCDLIFQLIQQNSGKEAVLNDLAGRLGCGAYFEGAENQDQNQSIENIV